MRTGFLPPAARLVPALRAPARFPQPLAFDHGDLHRCVALLRDRRDYALALLEDLRQERNRLRPRPILSTLWRRTG